MDGLIDAIINEVSMHQTGRPWFDAPLALRLNLRKRITDHLAKTLDMAVKLDEHAPAILALQAQTDKELAA